MAITFNRQPVGVNTPSSGDTGYQYFNHYNWKGINQNKNFLLVDQETFADAKNVYVDDEGILRSRLPLRFKHKFIGKNIKSIENYNGILLCIYSINNEWYIGIIDNEEWSADYKILGDYPVKAFKNGKYLYIFTNEKILTYDSDEKEINNTEMYNAITRIYTGSNYENYEEENLFSNYSRYQYILASDTIDAGTDVINQNAINRTGTYTHYVNEERVTHEVVLDENYDFLNIIHQPLLFDTNGFSHRNIYFTTVSTATIYDKFIYRFYNNKLERASISDGIFEVLYEELEYSDFVKVNYHWDQKYAITLVYGSGIRCLDIDGNELEIPENLSQYLRTFADKIVDIFVSEDKNAVLYFDRTFGETYHKLLFYALDTGGSEDVPILLCSRLVYSDIYSLNDKLIHFVDEFERSNFILNITLNVNSLSLSEDTWGPQRTCVNDVFNILTMSVTGCALAYGTLTYNGDYLFYRPSNPEYYIDTTRDDFTNLNSLSLVNGNIHYALEFEYGIGNQYKKVVLGTINGSGATTLKEFDVMIDDDVYYNGSFYLKSSNALYLISDTNKFITDKVGEFVSYDNSKYWFYLSDDVVLSNYKIKSQPVDILINKSNKYSNVDILLKNQKIFFSNKNELFIGDIIIDEDDEERLWFKKSNKNVMDNNITGLHQISDTELAIFTDDGTWYNTISDGVYFYNKSKLVPILKNNSDLITLSDSTTTLMPGINGIFALSYQNFINTTEQSTLNLTTDLSSLYSLFKTNVKSINWKHYVLFYEIGNLNILIYDTKLTSWWLWEIPFVVNGLFIYNNVINILSNNSLFEFKDVKIYKDSDFNLNELSIDWFIESQKLHLNANNYYKHITNLTLSSIEKGEQKIAINLNVKNYRKYVDNGKAENFDYKIDVIRTFVKRLNYAKVCEFQYRLSSDDESALNVPLALSNISIKYKIGGQVR